MSHTGNKNLTKAKEVILRAIAMYKDYGFLWDQDHPDYSNKDCRTYAYEAILEVYKEYDPNATVKTAMKKILNLRTNYVQELRKVKDSKRAGTGKVHVPTIWYYNAFRFLESTYYETASSDNDSTHTEDISKPRLSDANTDRRSPEVTAPPKRKKRRGRPISISPSASEKEPPMPQVLLLQEPLQQTSYREHRDHTENIEPASSLKDNDWEVLGKSIGLQLRDLNPRQLIIAQKIISDAIYYGKLGLLTENSSLNLGPSKPIPHQPYITLLPIQQPQPGPSSNCNYFIKVEPSSVESSPSQSPN